MTSRVARRVPSAVPRGRLAREAGHHVLCRPHTARTLAGALGVSVATITRVLAELRRSLAREGKALVSVKEGAAWRYEIRDRAEDLWESDPFIRSIGFARGVRRPKGQGVDDALYGRARTRR